MLTLSRYTTDIAPASKTLTLTFDQRQKCRLRAVLDSGEDVGVLLERGTVLKEGDRLTGEEGVVVQIRAALETVSVAHCADALQFARACYHLGNRHVPLQILPGELRYLHDHVLDDLLHGLGIAVQVQRAAFEPEPGAYAQGHANSGHHAHEH
jgi:urease accessory protein